MPLDRLAQPDDVLRALGDVMAGRVDMPLREVVAGLRRVGVRLPNNAVASRDLVLDALESEDGLWTVTDSSVRDIGALLDGRTCTHRLTAAEVEDACLTLDFDFPGLAFDHVIATGLTLPDGTVVEAKFAPESPDLRVAVGTTTWTDLGRQAGDLVGVVFGDRAARLISIDDVADGAELVDDLDRILDGDDALLADDLFDELVSIGDHFRQPVAPLSELLPRLGFAVSGDVVAASSGVLSDGERRGLAEDLANTFELEHGEADDVARILQLVHLLEDSLSAEGAPQPDPESGDAALIAWLTERMKSFEQHLQESGMRLLEVRRDVAEPWLAEVVAAAALDVQRPCPEGLALLAELLQDTERLPATRDEAASLAYLIGRCKECVGEPVAAESHFQRALALVPDHGAALTALAGIAADRGSYEAAASLLDRAGATDQHPLRMAIESVSGGTSAPARLPGRNAPCWCGSGRKFKVCHAHGQTTPLPERADSILHRALAWEAISAPGLLREVLMYGLDVGGRESLETVVELLPDVMLFEGGGLAAWLDQRAALIPADEALLAQQWLMRPRSLFDVEAVTPGVGLVLRDVMTGDRQDVSERTASAQLQVGHLVLTRVAPIGDRAMLYGGVIPIHLHEREPLLELLASEPVPLDMIGFVAGRFRLPTLVTPEGDPMVEVVGRFTTSAPKKLRAALDSAFEAEDADTWSLTEVGPAGGRRPLASLHLEGRDLEVTTFSEQRFEAVLQLLDGLDAPLAERSREVTDLRAAAEAQGDAGEAAPPTALDQESPGVQESLAAYIADYERAWLDESIPALGGITPRQAAADPTRRDDLIRLLDSFPAAGKRTEMDGARLKAALGL